MPLDALGAIPSRPPLELGAQAIKPRPSVALAPFHHPAATCGHPPDHPTRGPRGGEEQRGRSRCREEDREITGAGAGDTARHGFWSYTASTLHCTAILSPSTPTVSRMPLRPLLNPMDTSTHTSTHGRTPQPRARPWRSHHGRITTVKVTPPPWLAPSRRGRRPARDQ